MAKMKKSKYENDEFVEKDEKYSKKMKKKDMRSMKTAGLATELKKSEKNKNKMNGPKIKVSSKGC